ncbi:MAG TPA: carboxymuconolactone decarboxylase family protein [Polyangiaceae bacterium]|nr:carboxymuconolactone decarboxylase family protein [Polyangiaceae bacterium]
MAKSLQIQERLDPHQIAPELIKPLLELSAKIAGCGLESSLMDLVKLRASQINGCAFCLHMHASHARKSGEAEMRLHVLPAWRESPLYTPRERAALAWTEALTLLAETQAPDDVYAEVALHFTEKERVALTMVIVTINGWNRVAVGFRRVHAVEDAHAAA